MSSDVSAPSGVDQEGSTARTEAPRDASAPTPEEIEQWAFWAFLNPRTAHEAGSARLLREVYRLKRCVTDAETRLAVEEELSERLMSASDNATVRALGDRLLALRDQSARR